jgi:hypothetical protein
MKLEYNILWIDNDLQSYIDNNSVNSISDFLFERGFEPTIETLFDEADLEFFIGKHDYDLIISDYNLEHTTGDVIIEQIRNVKHLDTEILFYTARDNYKTKPEVKERLAFIERLTFQIGRDNLLSKIERVIDLTLKKLLELNATRGLITAATSSLDVEIEEIYFLLIEMPIDDALKLRFEKIFKTDYKEVKKRLLKQCKAQRDAYTNDLKTYFSLSDAFRKWDILKEILRLNIPNGFDLDLFKRYYSEVIDIRNKFAHAKAEQIDGKTVLRGQFGGSGFQFDVDACIKIRKDLINHKRNIQNLRNAISG